MQIYNTEKIENPNTEEYVLNYKHKAVLYDGNKIIFHLSFFLNSDGINAFAEPNIDTCVIKIIKDNSYREFYIMDMTEPVCPYLKNIIKFLNICKSYNKSVTILTGQRSSDITDLYKLNGAEIIFFPLFNLMSHNREHVYSSFYKENTLEKKYLTLNRAYKPMRESLYNYLKNNDLLKFGEYSFKFQNVSSFNENIDKNNAWAHAKSIISNLDFNKKCFLNFVIETINEDYYNFDGKKIKEFFSSEKTYKALYSGLPFILIGESNIINTLKSYGIKTFSDYWDEGYDSFSNRNGRFEGACNVLKNICYESDSRLREIYNDTEFIHKHNVELVDSILNNNLKILKEKIYL